jgi:hypothetical protein
MAIIYITTSIQMKFIVTSKPQLAEHITIAILKPIQPSLITLVVNRSQMAVDDH